MKKKITKKNSHHSTNQSLPEKYGDVRALAFSSIDTDEHLDWVGFKKTHITEREVMRIGYELVKWAVEDSDALKIRQFFRKKGIDKDTVTRWKKKFPEFKRLYQFALDAIGDRREVLALNRKFSESIVLKTMGIYDPDFVELLKEQASFTQGAEQTDKRFVINVTPIPDSPLVPKKEE